MAWLSWSWWIVNPQLLIFVVVCDSISFIHVKHIDDRWFCYWSATCLLFLKEAGWLGPILIELVYRCSSSDELSRCIQIDNARFFFLAANHQPKALCSDEEDRQAHLYKALDVPCSSSISHPKQEQVSENSKTNPLSKANYPQEPCLFQR